MSHTGLRARVLAHLLADTSPIGPSYADLAAIFPDFAGRPLQSCLAHGKENGVLFTLGRGHATRYYPSLERREACREAHEAFLAQVAAKRKKAKQKAKQDVWMRRHYEKQGLTGEEVLRRMEALRAKRAAGIRKESVDATVTVKAERQSWATAEPVIPPHVKVQRLPSGKDERFSFTPPPGWRGAITQDWLNRRLQESK
jgi:hypothetical protein